MHVEGSRVEVDLIRRWPLSSARARQQISLPSLSLHTYSVRDNSKRIPELETLIDVLYKVTDSTKEAIHDIYHGDSCMATVTADVRRGRCSFDNTSLPGQSHKTCLVGRLSTQPATSDTTDTSF